jgi:ribosomal protein S18 acetylase RimI-like enzyme
MTFREIIVADVPDLFPVRVATRENTLSLQELHALGITIDSVRKQIASTHRGWLCEVNNRVIGFSMGNRQTGEMWVIAVLPEFEDMGVGSRLLMLVEEWLWSEGWQEIWLTTDINTKLRAYGFYKKYGWKDDKIEDDLRYMVKTKSNL